MKLTNPTDNALNCAFAEYVAGWTIRKEVCHGFYGEGDRTNSWWMPPGQSYPAFSGLPCAPNFTRSFDAVLPWLEKLPHWDIAWDGTQATCRLTLDDYTVYYESVAEDAPTAAVLSMLRAHGCEVTFT